ncbi:Rha family transcriptional regulator [Rhodovulum marinum]|uniref:Rha family phage regulatory protein n=1 Tax=Rhodovulum marinum TaxID=320662 RepID=A0A4V2SRS8_9RHOB|nr:Rha family transcriptional regulator [Rhodovulum marinum]TCP43946.1 Rha family phage regulatory protein [Rhodovulum marinum]
MSVAAEVPARQPVVFARNGGVFASSRDVAAFFGKRHDNVLRDIERLISEEPALLLGPLLKFEESFIEVETGNGTARRFRVFEMTRDGFTLLAMGFTGPRALRWKLCYIEAFNRMEAALQGQAAAASVAPDGLEQALSACREVRLTWGRRAAQDFWSTSDLVGLYDPAKHHATQVCGDGDDPLRVFLSTQCVVSGDRDDVLLARDLIARFRAWQVERGLPAWGRRRAQIRLAALSGVYRDPESGATFCPFKSSDSYYRGIAWR